MAAVRRSDGAFKKEHSLVWPDITAPSAGSADARE
jgi:hypothetical protein